MQEVGSEETEHFLPQEKFLVEMTSDGLIDGFSSQLEFIVGADNAKLTRRLNQKTDGKL
jgi:hypothetical protein